jgi:hypothetical protein
MEAALLYCRKLMIVSFRTCCRGKGAKKRLALCITRPDDVEEEGRTWKKSTHDFRTLLLHEWYTVLLFGGRDHSINKLVGAFGDTI